MVQLKLLIGQNENDIDFICCYVLFGSAVVVFIVPGGVMENEKTKEDHPFYL